MKVVIFDFDGTLADTLEVLLTISNRLAQEFNYPEIDPQMVGHLKGLSSRDIIRQSKISVLKIPFLVRRLREELGQEIHQVHPFPGIADMLHSLRDTGHCLGIVSSNSTENVNAFLARRQWQHLFDFVHSGTTIFGKHRVISRLLKRRAINPADVIYVGDETRDIEAAAKVPIQVVAVAWGFNTREILEAYNPACVVSHPRELVHFVNTQVP